MRKLDKWECVIGRQLERIKSLQKQENEIFSKSRIYVGSKTNLSPIEYWRRVNAVFEKMRSKAVHRIERKLEKKLKVMLKNAK